MLRRDSPFLVLGRAFFAQFFTSESVTSDIQLRQTIIWILAFLITPGVVFVIQMFPTFEFIVFRSRLLHRPAMIDEALVLFGVMFATYSMVTIGLVAVFVWDALAFDRLDAMVLGPLPLRASTIVSAKLAALGALLMGASAAMTLLTAVPVAEMVGDHLGVAVMTRIFVAHLTATNMAALFVFAAIVSLRGTIALVLGPRASAAVGSLLQFLFVGALLSFAILIPAGINAARRIVAQGTGPDWLPGIWFLGVFEWMRGSGGDEFRSLAASAVTYTGSAVVTAIVVSIAGFRRQMHLALAPPAFTGPLGGARVSRSVARLIVGRGQLARAVVDFVLLTIARNRAQQAPIAMNAAIGLAFVVGGLTRVTSIEGLMQPRSAVLWIPLVLAYWAIVGMRAAFFVPVEFPAAWSFRFHAPEPAVAYWSGVRAAMIGFILPPAVLATVILIAPLTGWHVAGWHALVVGAVVLVLGELASLTVDFVPFTRAYEPGHARLKTRWPVYALGVFIFCWLPSRFLLWWPTDPIKLLEAIGTLVLAAGALECVGRRRARRWSIPRLDDAEPEYDSVTLLNVGFQGYRVSP